MFKVLRRWWHNWIIADSDESKLLDKWDREARCPYCGASPNVRCCEFGKEF